MKNQNILVVGQQPWDIEIGSNCKNIAMEFAKTNKVLYVNAPLDRVTKVRKAHKKEVVKRLEINEGKRPDLEQIDSNLWVLQPKMLSESINKIGFLPFYNYLNKRNNKVFACRIKEACKRLGFNDFVLFNDSLMFNGYYLKELLRPEMFIYYVRDYLIVQSYFKRHGPRMEHGIMGKADLVVANSTYLSNYASKANPNSHYVGQGCDFEIFEKPAFNIPEDVKSIGGPKIGYVGFLTTMRLDIQLIAFLAKKRPQWKIVLVGPEDEGFERSELHKMPNVIFLGAKKPEELPDYINAFDVCINPQEVNLLTIGNYPRKIDEYLAMGKPTVASETKAMDVFKDYCYLAKDYEDFLIKTEEALNNNTTELAGRRAVFAKSHTWENSVNQIYKAIGQSSLKQAS